MFRATSLFVTGSIAGLFAQADESIWTKSAWGIMCLSFMTGVGVLFRINQKLHDDIVADKDGRISDLERKLSDAKAELREMRGAP